MKGCAKPAIVAAMILAVVGGIARLMTIEMLVGGRAYAGAAAILLLLAIAVNTLPQESSGGGE